MRKAPPNWQSPSRDAKAWQGAASTFQGLVVHTPRTAYRVTMHLAATSWLFCCLALRLCTTCSAHLFELSNEGSHPVPDSKKHTKRVTDQVVLTASPRCKKGSSPRRPRPTTTALRCTARPSHRSPPGHNHNILWITLCPSCQYNTVRVVGL